jgi:hypothetical protein
MGTTTDRLPVCERRYLKSKSVDVQLPNMAFLLPETLPQDGIFVVDTSDLFAALEGESGGNRRSLDRVCRHLQIPTSYLHNAGNDAHVCSGFWLSVVSRYSRSLSVQYTLLALQSMASGDPVDMQREKRWPNRTGSTGVPNGPNQPQTGAGIKVNFDAEEDEDFSDEEGPLGSMVDTNHVTSSNGNADEGE